ncbi:pentapeptide repeat-containing protein [Streptomyces sp. NPDC058678]|uniref:pentapeptide repeat-containing protein n=1 Tax=Streptomyces sp. NPDC058678 TaxID=3346595 RepID=UPI00366A0813
MSDPSSTSQPPDWPHCGFRANSPDDPIGCRGHVAGTYDACLAHLEPGEYHDFLSSLRPGDDIDLRGTRFAGSMLRDLLHATEDEESNARIRLANFEECTFEGNIDFSDSLFEHLALFNRCKFRGLADFNRATFQGGSIFAESEFTRASFVRAIFQGVGHFKECTFGNADFTETTFQSFAQFDDSEFLDTCTITATFEDDATFIQIKSAKEIDFSYSSFNGAAAFARSEFTGQVKFDSVRFVRQARFDGVSSSGPGALSVHSAQFTESCIFTGASLQYAIFENTTFGSRADFNDCSFSDRANFAGCRFRRDFNLKGSVFTKSRTLGPISCARTADLSLTTFCEPWIFLGATKNIDLRMARWEAIASVRISSGIVDLSDAVITQPFSISLSGVSTSDTDASGVQIASLAGVDCTFLTVSDVDLSACAFVGARNLDLLRLEGNRTFGAPPLGRRWRSGFPFKWTQRNVINEERQWRALPDRPAHLRRGWEVLPQRQPTAPNLASLTIVYRQLRKAREDAKDEPGAADFYYGEMEMRRHSRAWSQAERWLLQAYWLLSGYGLRASRALAWLSLAMLTTILLMMGVGLPQDSPKQEAIGTVPSGGGKVTFEITQGDPQNPQGDHFTGERFDKALSVTLNSVVFRSSGQDLTTAGGYIEMASRFSEPVLLGLAVLAIRGRVKR